MDFQTYLTRVLESGNATRYDVEGTRVEVIRGPIAGKRGCVVVAFFDDSAGVWLDEPVRVPGCETLRKYVEGSSGNLRVLEPPRTWKTREIASALWNALHATG